MGVSSQPQTASVSHNLRQHPWFKSARGLLAHEKPDERRLATTTTLPKGADSR